jgi:hypothetical protein
VDLPVRERPKRFPQVQDTNNRFEEVCLKCLEKDSSKRYGSAEALAEDLECWLAGEPIKARPVSRSERLWRWCQRNPLVAALVGLAVTSMLIGTAVASYFAVQARSEARRAYRNLYDAQMNLAQRAWEQADVGRLQDILDAQQPRRTGWEDLRGFEWYYWNHICHPDLLTLEENRGTHLSIVAIAFNPDGKSLAGMADTPAGSTVKIWERGSGRELLNLGRGTSGLAYSPDGMQLSVALVGGEIRVWHLPTAREVLLIKGQGKPLTSLIVSPHGKRIAAIEDRDSIRIWDTATGRSSLLLRGHSSKVTYAGFSPDSKRLISASWDSTVRVWDVETGREVTRMPMAPGEQVFAMALSPDGQRVALALGDNTVRLRQLATGQELLTL